MSQSNPILIVDDDADTRDLIREVLQDDGLSVETADDGMKALVLVAELRPALVLLDMNLPVVNGFGVAAGMCARFGNEVPIVLLSGSEYTPQMARQLGASGYLQKPFAVEELLSTVHGLLDKHRHGVGVAGSI